MVMVSTGRGLALAALGALAMGAAAGSAAAQTTTASGRGAWVHVRVDEGRRQSKVAVNLPVSVVEAALQAAPETIVADGRIHLGRYGHGRHDLSVADLRKAWAELKKSGDAEFVSVEEDDQTVKVSRAGNLVLVHVDKPSGKESVRVELPIEVVDALLSADGEELNVRAAFAQLQKRRGDIVSVHDDDSTVRIWIDEGN